MPKDAPSTKKIVNPLDDEEHIAAMQVVAFKLHDEEYGVNIFQVQEINDMSDITRVPFALHQRSYQSARKRHAR